MKTILGLVILLATLTSCSNKWIMLDSTNKYLPVLKRDGTITTTSVRLVEDLKIEATVPDTLTSKSKEGTTTVRQTIREAKIIKAKTKGTIIENGTLVDGSPAYYFVPDDKKLKAYIIDKVGGIPLNTSNDKVFIIVENSVAGRNGVMKGTRFKIDTNSPGFEFKIKEEKVKE
jgi:hypothetical protein